MREKSKRNERNNQKKTILLKSQKMRRKKITQHILCAMYCLSGTQNNMHCIALFSLFVSFCFVSGISFSFSVAVSLIFNDAGNNSNSNWNICAFAL